MIHNTALQKWHRLQQKQLNQQFLNEMIRGLECSPFEAKAILNMVYQVYAPYFELSPALKPGQLFFQVVSCETSPSTHLADSQQVTVLLTLDAGEADLQIRQHQGVIGLRQHRLQRLSHEAFQQGGLLTVEDLAVRLLNCGERTLSRDLAQLHAKGILLPLRSTVKDMGRTLSHRSLIVTEWLAGKEYSAIAKTTHHSIPSVKNYVSKFKRVIALAKDGHEAQTIAFLVKLSIPLVQDYYTLYQTCERMPHREHELDALTKKNFSVSDHDKEEPMIPVSSHVKHYQSAQDRFLKPALQNFFATEFPRLFGPVMRETIADALLQLIEQLHPEQQRLQPGQVLWNALDQRTRGDSPHRKYVPVILSLVTEEDVKLMTAGTSRTTVTKQAIARIVREAYQQGGILSMRDIALLTLRSDSYVSILRKAYEHEHETILPHTGVLHDMGSCISHKAIIVRKVLLDHKDPADVARETAHTQQAVDHYLHDYHRVKSVYDHHQDLQYIHLVTGIAKHVVNEYVEIIKLCQK